jgi:hypothetical protein
MHRTNIYLDERQIAALDEVASARGVSRAELVRDYVDGGLNGGSSDLESDLRAIEQSAGIDPDREPFERRPGEREAYLESLRRR